MATAPAGSSGIQLRLYDFGDLWKIRKREKEKKRVERKGKEDWLLDCLEGFVAFDYLGNGRGAARIQRIPRDIQGISKLSAPKPSRQ